MIFFCYKFSEDGSEWQPTENGRICSQHFVGGTKDRFPHQPGYLPTIYPFVKQMESASEQRSQGVLDRFKR